MRGLVLRDLVFGPGVMAVTVRDRRIAGNELASFTPAEEVAKGLEPIARGVRCHAVEQGDDVFPRQGRHALIAMLLAEVFEDGAPQGGCAAGEASPSLRAI